MSTPPVFLLDDPPPHPGPGSEVVLTGAEARHAGVQRLRPGERVDLCDGRGLRLRCEVTSVRGGELRCEVVEVRHEPPPSCEIMLVQALVKGDGDAAVITAAVEVGVDALIPWQAPRSVVLWRGERGSRAHDRWVRCARAATKQSRRAVVPPVAPVVSSGELAALVAQVVGAGGAALLLHEGATTPFAAAELPDNPGRVLVIVGPEGGFEDVDLAAFRGAGAQAIRLGPTVMRAATAGPIAIAMLCERLGRWSGDNLAP